MSPRRNHASRDSWHGTVSGYTNHGCRCDACRAAQRAYREANRDDIAAKKRAYREANRDDIAAKQRAYREANPGKNAAACKRSREQRKTRKDKENRSLCDICGIELQRTERVRGTNTCVDCVDVERGIA